MLEVDEARRRILRSFRPTQAIERRVAEALGYVATEDLTSSHPLPRFDNSSMDGYAVRATEAAGATEERPVRLPLGAEVAAGSSGETTLAPGTAARIMTGAPVPEGADAIVPIEVARESEGHVDILEAPDDGAFIRRAGSDIGAGQIVVRAGDELGPGELALLASLGLSPVLVHARPKVGVVVTGAELVAPEDEPGPGQIRDSNSVALTALVREAGGEPLTFAAIGDNLAATEEVLRRAAEEADLIVSSGGVSVGRYDFVKEAVESLGSIDFWRVAMQPGKPVVSGRVGDVPFLGLPGNPVSIHVGFEQFVRPAIRLMRGCTGLLRPVLQAKLAETISKRPGRLHLVRVRLSWEADGLVATPTGPQGSHVQSSLIACDGLVRFPILSEELRQGAEVEVEVWRVPGKN
jgi:molybdopterin molybdotransferase